MDPARPDASRTARRSVAARSLSVRSRVWLGVVSMLVPLLVVSGGAVVALEATLTRFADTAEEALDDALPLARLQSLVLRVERSGWVALSTPSPRATAAYRADQRRLDDAFADVLRESLTEEGGRTESARRQAEAAVGLLDRALLARAAGGVVDTTDVAARVGDLLDAAADDLHAATGLSERDIVEEYEQARAEQRRAITGIAGLVLAGLVMAVTGGAHLARSVLGPLGALHEAVRHLGQGVLSHRVGLRRRDEFGELARALDTMAGDLQRIQGDLAHHALHDALTGLPNRVLLADRTEQALARRAREGRHVALLLVDLDGFKAVNDGLGHGVGDEVLRAAADRLRRCVRPTDTAARLGGDEFAVLVEAGTAAEATGVAERIVRSLRPAFTHAGQSLFLTASVGVCVAPDRLATADDLLRGADLAMYRAKRDGKDAFRVYDPAMGDDADDQLRLDGDLRGALDRGELSVHYQPILGIDGGPLVAVEALLRWEHPGRGTVPPDVFIPVAETTGLITSLGAWVLDEACRQLRQWDDAAGPGATEHLQMSVNLSARQLADEHLPALVERTLRRHGIDPGRLILEITESTMMGDVAATVRRLHRLKALGVQLAVDDFGTGYSSLQYLQQFPVDRIKIDRSFVAGLDSAEGRALAQGIMSLARALTLEPIAEGVEHEDQRATLDALGCRLGQGYHFARPGPPAEIARWLTSATPPAVAVPTPA